MFQAVFLEHAFGNIQCRTPKITHGRQTIGDRRIVIDRGLRNDDLIGKFDGDLKSERSDPLARCQRNDLGIFVKQHILADFDSPFFDQSVAYGELFGFDGEKYWEQKVGSLMNMDLSLLPKDKRTRRDIQAHLLKLGKEERELLAMVETIRPLEGIGDLVLPQETPGKFLQRYFLQKKDYTEDQLVQDMRANGIAPSKFSKKVWEVYITGIEIPGFFPVRILGKLLNFSADVAEKKFFQPYRDYYEARKKLLGIFIARHRALKYSSQQDFAKALAKQDIKLHAVMEVETGKRIPEENFVNASAGLLGFDRKFFIKKYMQQLAPLKGTEWVRDAAMISGAEQATPPPWLKQIVKQANDVGGIDLNPAQMNLQIKRDGNGVPLPVDMQPANMDIDGFIPVIINVTPVDLPLLLGQQEDKAKRREI